MIGRQRDWNPQLAPRYRRVIGLLLAMSPFVAGIDFLMGEHSETMTFVEAAMPAPAWGGLLVLAGMMSTVGYLFRIPNLCIWGLHLSGVIFTALAVGIAWASIDEYGGFRGPWLYLVVAACSWLAALGYIDQIRNGRR